MIPEISGSQKKSVKLHLNWNKTNLPKKEKNMKLFQLTQKNFARLGIDLSQSHRKYRFFNRKILLAYFHYWLAIISFCVFFIHEAHNFQEYMEVIFRIFLPITITICFTIIIFKMEKLFEICGSCERIVDKSKRSNIIMNNQTKNVILKYINVSMVRLSRIESNLQQNQSSNRKMVQIYIFLLC